MNEQSFSFWQITRRQFAKHPVGSFAFYVVLAFCLVGTYAPFLASSKPIVLSYDGELFFPLFRYLFFPGFYTKRLDIFFNILIFVLPLSLLAAYFIKGRIVLTLASITQLGLFMWLILDPPLDPASDPKLNKARQVEVQSVLSKSGEDPLLAPFPRTRSWEFELEFMSPYAKINEVLRMRQRRAQHESLQVYAAAHGLAAQRTWLSHELRRQRLALLNEGVDPKKLPEREEMEAKLLANASNKTKDSWESLPTLWQLKQANLIEERVQQKSVIEALEGLYAGALADYETLSKEYAPLSPALMKAKLSLQTAGRVLRRESKHRVEGEAEESYSLALHEFERAEAAHKALAVSTASLRLELSEARRTVIAFREAKARLAFIDDQQQWLTTQNASIGIDLMPLIRPFHWEDDAGGEQSLNQYVSWWHLTRINRKDLVSALIFGIRISMIVGITAVGISLLIGIPIGAMAGYYGGKIDMVTFRLIEIWEAMPVFFMLLMVVAVTQSKSIFLVVSVLGIFGWTGFCRYLRGEFLKQRHLPYVDACRAMGFSDARIIFSHVLPNAIPPLLTLLPFAILGAITSEAGLSFLGLGEEGSCSWGVLMDEGRTAFPGESYLLWPPALLLTLLLVAIALVGDALRDALDPKMRH